MADEAKDGRGGASARAFDRGDAALGGRSVDALTGAWFEAAAAGDAPALGALVRLNPAVIEIRDERGRSALHVAAETIGEPAIEAAKLLIAAGTPSDAADANGHTALGRAIAARNRPMALFLLEVGAGTEGCLGPALVARDIEIVRELVDCGADLDESQNGETPAGMARRLGFPEAAALIEAELQRRS